jgi:hypothetical protein
LPSETRAPPPASLRPAWLWRLSPLCSHTLCCLSNLETVPITTSLHTQDFPKENTYRFTCVLTMPTGHSTLTNTGRLYMFSRSMGTQRRVTKNTSRIGTAGRSSRA